MALPSNHKFALACGVAGAYVDVTAYVVLDSPVSRSWGKQSDFTDTAPGKLSFTLDNADGRFTPDNTSSALSTRLVEGMGVCWQIGSRFIAGKIRAIDLGFLSMNATSARVRITCDDMLGSAGRHDIAPLIADSITIAAGQQLLWRMDDAVGNPYAVEANNSLLGPLVLTPANGSTFGAPTLPGLPGKQLSLVSAVASADSLVTTSSTTLNIQYPQTSMGFWGFWATPTSTAGTFLTLNFAGILTAIQLYVAGGSVFTSPGTLGTPVTYVLPAAVATSPHYVSIGLTTSFSGGLWTITVTLYVDGVSRGSSAYQDSFGSGTPTSLTTAQRQVTQVALVGQNSGLGLAPTVVSRLAHTLTLSHEEYAIGTTEGSLIQAAAATAPEITLGTLPTDLSTAKVAFPASMSGSALDALNAVIRTEQGYLYSATTGTLLAPVEKIMVRSRTRSPSALYTFNTTADILDSPEFIRSLTDTVSAVAVTGIGTSVNVSDATLVPIVGSSSTSLSVLNTGIVDTISAGQDRLQRGHTVGLRVQSFTVEARSTSVDRWADLTAIIPGDSVNITGLPVSQIGSTNCFGYIIGGDESHTGETDRFTFYFVVAQPATAIFDTSRFSNGGAFGITVAMTNVATTMTAASGSFSTVDTPYLMIIDSEVVSVNSVAAGGAVATISRGVSGTTAATHSIGASPEIWPAPSLFAF